MFQFLLPVAKAVGSALVAKGAEKIATKVFGDDNYDAQKEFAQQGLYWRVQDAKRAGLHPLAAIGSAGAAFSPSFQAGDAGIGSGVFDELMKDSGQNTIRAQRANQTDHQREMEALSIRRATLENQLLEGQITQLWASVMGQPTNPPRPGGPVATFPSGVIKGQQSPPGLVQVTPSPSESARVGDRGMAAGQSPLFRQQNISEHSSAPLLSPESGQVFEAYGEFLKPVLALGAHAQRGWDHLTKGSQRPSDSLLPKDHKWVWSVARQSWKAVPLSTPKSTFTPRRDGRSARVPGRGVSSSW